MFNLPGFQRQHGKHVLRVFETNSSMHAYSYAELYDQSIAFSTNIQNYLSKSESSSAHPFQNINIAILLPVHSPAILPAIVGIENAGCVSCFFDPAEHFDSIEKQLLKLQTNIILCDSNTLQKLKSNIQRWSRVFSCSLFDTDCILIQIDHLMCKPHVNLFKDDCEDLIRSSKICFYALTSGSCGVIKPIGVTYKCFMPNITSLGNLYNVTERDLIFVSSPPTFDPFMIDICVALHYEATLVMVDHKLRCDAKLLLDTLFPRGQKSNVTIMQTTPSLFMRWTSNDIKHRVLSSDSALRILALGGEPFPTTSTLRIWISCENDFNKRIFNLYGLTEMSCWAAVYEITKNDVLSNRSIPIGQPIDAYTTFQINADGELVLKSTIRKCFQPQLTYAQVIDNQFELILHTGDLVECENDELYFTSRINSVIKFYGRKINLDEIQQTAKNVDNVEDAICIFDEKHNSFALFVKTSEDFNDVNKRIQKALQKVIVHVKCYCVSEFPLTVHGKVSKKDLLNSINASKLQSIQSKFLELINESLGTTMQLSDIIQCTESEKRLKKEYDSSFIHLGGSSLKAIQIVNEIERSSSQSIVFLLPMLLDEQVSIRDILSRLRDEGGELRDEVTDKRHEDDSDRIIAEVIPHWKINMDKCIDATPTVCVLKNGEIVVSVGSHSKLIYNISMENGEIISKLELPDRIESQVVQIGDCGIVGCYDGKLYCFEISNALIKWQFDSGAMIKCRAVLFNSLVLFGNYNESKNVWCLNADDGTLKWCQKIGAKSIYANPVKMNDENCLICSLDGSIALVNFQTAHILWSFNAKAPIFSTPSVFETIHHKVHIIVAAVNGIIYNLSGDGVPVWSHQIDGNIFSSVEFFPSSENNKNIKFVFGSQNRYLYCFEMSTEGCSLTEVWKILTSASIRSSPVFIRSNHELYGAIFSSDGVIKVISCDNGKLIRQSRINGDVFSTPVIYNGRLFVGSRNNFLYCIDLNNFTEEDSL